MIQKKPNLDRVSANQSKSCLDLMCQLLSPFSCPMELPQFPWQFQFPFPMEMSVPAATAALVSPHHCPPSQQQLLCKSLEKAFYDTNLQYYYHSLANCDQFQCLM